MKTQNQLPQEITPQVGKDMLKSIHQYIDKDIASVELVKMKRGSYVVSVKWENIATSQVFFSNKKEAQYYYNWITGNPSHPLHKHNKTLGL